MGELEDKLLSYLRQALGDLEITYREGPVRLDGGFDTNVYRFRLHGGPLEQPLVLRLFRPHAEGTRARMESVVQTAVARAGIPAAPAHVCCTDSTVLGAPFFVMDLLEGRPLLHDIEEPAASEIMGRTHALLHGIDPGIVSRALADNDLPGYRLEERLIVMHDVIANEPWLEPVFGWLTREMPPEETVAVCHGDFHKLNILTRDGEVSGILDWSNLSIMEPAFDVVTTAISFSVISKHLTADGHFDPVDLDAVVDTYLEAYEDVRVLDRASWDYYWTLRSALVIALAARGVEIFRHGPMLSELADGIERLSRITVDLPPELGRSQGLQKP